MIGEPFDRHATAALQFSGGKDSLATALLLRPYWDRITFYHLDAGDLLPPVRELVAKFAALVPGRFVRIETDAAEWQKTHGLPTDLMPTTNTPAGRAIGLSKQRLADRFDCCASNIMAPMHARMVADKVTLVIRGTKRVDMPRLPAQAGDTSMGYEICLPIVGWSHDEVFDYLRESWGPLPDFYQHRVNAPECATCAAWWDEGRAAYLKKHQPALFAVYARKLQAVAQEIRPVLATLSRELRDLHHG